MSPEEPEDVLLDNGIQPGCARPGCALTLGFWAVVLVVIRLVAC